MWQLRISCAPILGIAYPLNKIDNEQTKTDFRILCENTGLKRYITSWFESRNKNKDFDCFHNVVMATLQNLTPGSSLPSNYELLNKIKYSRAFSHRKYQQEILSFLWIKNGKAFHFRNEGINRNYRTFEKHIKIWMFYMFLVPIISINFK